MRSLSFRSTRALPSGPPRCDFVRRTAAAVVVATGAAVLAMVGGYAAAQSVDCGPGTAGGVYPVTDCMVLTSTNAIGAGGKLTVSGGGFKPVSTVSVVLHSDTVSLGSLTSNGDGSVDGAVSIPSSVPAGSHELDLSGVNPDGTPRVLSASVKIEAATAAASGLSGWFWAGISALLLALLGIALVVARSIRGGRQVG